MCDIIIILKIIIPVMSWIILKVNNFHIRIDLVLTHTKVTTKYGHLSYLIMDSAGPIILYNNYHSRGAADDHTTNMDRAAFLYKIDRRLITME